MPDPTPQDLYETALYVQAVHLQDHAASLHVRVLPLPFVDCVLCQAIQGMVGQAHQLSESAPVTPRRTRS
jgi:hypothetical protein